VRFDPIHAFCQAKEETEEEVALANAPLELELSGINVGDVVDTYSSQQSRWVVSQVVDVTADGIRTRCAEDARAEWHSKSPARDDPLTILPLYTVSGKPDAKWPDSKYRPGGNPYLGLIPEGVDVPLEVAKCVQSMVLKVDRDSRDAAKKRTKLAKEMDVAVVKAVEKPREPVVPILAGMTPQQRAAFLTFCDSEREHDDMLPFVTILARWGAMEDAQKQTWERKRLLANNGDPFLPEAAPVVNVHSAAWPVPGGAAASGGGLAPPAAATCEPVKVLGPAALVCRPRALALQIAPFTNMPVRTPFGEGLCVAVADGTMHVKLGWGAAFIPVASVDLYARMFHAVPLFRVRKDKRGGKSVESSGGPAKKPKPELGGDARAAGIAGGEALVLGADPDIDPDGPDMQGVEFGLGPGFEDWLQTRKRQWFRRWWAFRGFRVAGGGGAAGGGGGGGGGSGDGGGLHPNV
jgi:hypothetical protein